MAKTKVRKTKKQKQATTARAMDRQFEKLAKADGARGKSGNSKP